MPKTYAIVANRTPQDVLADNDIILETGYTIEEAKIASIQYQKTGEFVAVWIEEEVKASPRPEPRICARRRRLRIERMDGSPLVARADTKAGSSLGFLLVWNCGHAHLICVAFQDIAPRPNQRNAPTFNTIVRRRDCTSH